MKTKKKKFIVIIILIVTSIILTIFLYYNAFFHTVSIERPQEPLKPYPYYSEEVTFQNTQADITLHGTLTMPSKNGNYPVVILISGSGPQNRDYEFSGHKPFLILANHLTTNGVAVLRYDDRVFGKSIEVLNESTIANFATDITSAITYLKTRKEINKDKIGLIGHSEGGIVAPMVASTCDDVNFIVLLGGPGIEGEKVILKQSELYPKVLGASKSEIKKSIAQWKQIIQMVTTSDNRDTLKADLVKFLEEIYDEIPSVMVPNNISKKLHVEFLSNRLSSASFISLLNYNPVAILKKVTCPVLALNGEKDTQVTPKENLTGINSSLMKGGNTNVTIKEIPNLNHFFQECKTGSPIEYKTIEQTFSPIALKEISDWILEKVK
tara:strand:- start:34 stop:1176 length:1143 start_codon:yes stop_codon:yes gene_type:complete